MEIGLRRSLHKNDNLPSEPEPISVIVAARNEAHNLPGLLTSIAQLESIDADYEVIIVNDHSTDESLKILRNWEGQFGIRVIDFQDEIPGYVGKKAALQKGIEAAQYDVLAFTDADCQVSPTWLIGISHVLRPDLDYILGYGTIYRGVGDTDLRLVNFERSIYYALAAAGLGWKKPITSSACNHIYRKSLFEKAGGFEGISHIASGDDDLLLMKMMPYIRKAIYNPAPQMQVDCYEGKNIVKAYYKNIRRASKFRYHPPYVKALSAFIFVYFALFYVALIRLFTGSGDILLLCMIMAKFLTELHLSQTHLAMAHKTHIGILYFPQIFVFPLQFIYYAIRGTLGKYRWK
ncbi:MAG: glycosyltransferase [Candidatus Cloacimonetes bacterium]|nr:glycosyltransferase [Candidatus Cloacimonadota bacterium]